MRRLLLTTLLLGLSAVPSAASPALPLGHAGRWITDAHGRVVILHGINMVYKRPPYAPDATGFGADDAAFLAAEGYDTVRLGVIYKAVEPMPGVYDDQYLARIARTIRTLAAHHITSLLDFHQDLYNERFQGEGWPDWAVFDDGLPAEPAAGFPANYLGMPALQHAYDNFYANVKASDGVGLEEHYARAWRHVAAYFRTARGVLGYDLLNEPWPGTAWQDCVNTTGCPASDAKLAAFTSRTVKAIRAADRRHLVFYEPFVLFDFGGGTTIGPFDKRAAFSFHDYCLAAGSSNSNDGCDTVDESVFDHADAQAQRTGDALLLTEFGATGAQDILEAMADRADRHMVGWQEWHYCGCQDPTTTGSDAKQAIVLDPAKPPRGANLDTAKLRVLSRPHPESVAGTPRAYGFDPATRRFTLRWSPRHAGGAKRRFGPRAVTEVLVPRRQYPRGYRATVRGGRVRSKPGAHVLRVTAERGASEVAVTVVPAR